MKVWNNREYTLTGKENSELFNYSDYEQNFLREGFTQCIDKMVLLKGTYKGKFDNYITFTTVRPYVDGTATFELCDHFNLFIDDIKDIIDIEKLEQNKKYYIFGIPYLYGIGSERQGIRLEKNLPFRPIFKVTQLQEKHIKVFEENCYHFDRDLWVRRKYQDKE